MRRSKVVLLLAIPVVLGVAVTLYVRWRHDSLYKWFQAHDQAYFVQVASDCDSILRRYPIPFSGFEADSQASGWFRVPVSDEALPAGIRALDPDYILVSTNRVWVNCGGRLRLDWGFMWRDESESPTNAWVLRSCITYGPERTLYVKEQP
jgi:hypothetical protein